MLLSQKLVFKIVCISTIFIRSKLETIHIIRQQKDSVGGLKKVIVADFHYYYIYANIVGVSKKVQTFANIMYGWSPCEKDLKRVLQKHHRILTNDNCKKIF